MCDGGATETPPISENPPPQRLRRHEAGVTDGENLQEIPEEKEAEALMNRSPAASRASSCGHGGLGVILFISCKQIFSK